MKKMMKITGDISELSTVTSPLNGRKNDAKNSMVDRKLIHDQPLLMKMVDNDGIKWLEKHLFLFNDSILITTQKQTEGTIKFSMDQDTIPLNRIQVESIQNNFEDHKNTFKINIFLGRGKFKNISFAAKNSLQKEEWIETINKARDEWLNNNKKAEDYFSTETDNSSSDSPNKDNDISLIKSLQMGKLGKKRKLIFDGVLSVMSRKYKDKWNKKRVFLFSDVLLITPEKKKFDLDFDYKSDGGELIDLAGATVESIPDNKKTKNCFRVSEHKNGGKIVVLSALSTKSQKDWMNLVKEEIETCTKLRFTSPRERISSSEGSPVMLKTRRSSSLGDNDVPILAIEKNGKENERKDEKGELSPVSDENGGIGGLLNSLKIFNVPITKKTKVNRLKHMSHMNLNKEGKKNLSK
eukprot:TRINITY_DN3316_c0_g1_i1.p1 TRINITY_DN3316_c0_g1~~TRINITY_DN3316_c0_g1_i1.p1  ORF type:complete len:409 (-),score=142.36 TRINITY_DN3316_c0_g1_i1:53-1279(-)